MIVVLPLFAYLVAFACGALIISHAHKWKLIANPNHRSSHYVPTPSGGGIGLVAAGSLTGLFLAWQSAWFYGVAVLAISCVLAVVGLWDDRRPLSALLRLGIQALMGACLLLVLGGMPELQRFPDAWVSRTLIYAVLLLVIVWWINLFNFMDGIDGLAGAQAIFMLLAGAVLLSRGNPGILSSPVFIWMLCIVGACAGFLVLNWAPAKIFMGDIGSIYLAFMVLSLGLLSIRNDWVPVLNGLAMWSILGASFVTDATVTLITRMVTGKRWHEAHRSHAYQRLARRLSRHRTVTLLFLGINIFWLLPLAAACLAMPRWAVVWLLLAYVPLIFAAVRVGAGKADGVQ